MALKQLLTNLEQGLNEYPNHNTPSTSGGFNYGQSTSIFDHKQFNQKSLRFGQGTAFDRPGGGFSNQPFQTNLITRELGFLLDNYGLLQKIPQGVDTVTDGFIRGGLITHAKRLVQDTERVGRFLLTPKGLSFIVKQRQLQKTNPKIDEPGDGFLGLSNLINHANQRTYNLGINTLASVASAGTGVRIKREGTFPTAHKGYADSDSLFKNNKRNRLINLFDDNIIKFNIGELYSYSGGPGSLYGIGRTTIFKVNDTTELTYPSNRAIFNIKDHVILSNSRRDSIKSGFINNSKYLLNNLLYNNGVDYKIIRIGGSTNDGKFVDEPTSKLNDTLPHTIFEPVVSTKSKSINFLRTLNKPGTNYDSIAIGTTSKTYHREERINMGNPGVKTSRGGLRDSYVTTPTKDGFLDYSVYDSSRIDKLNALDVFHSPNSNYGAHAVRDLIRFRFEMVDNDKPGEYDAIVFRAFLDNIDDNYSTSHNTFKYNGRGEEFYTYNSFKRNINFNFKIAASSRHEMMPLYRKLNFLVSNTAPDYGGGGRMRTPFTRLTIGHWLDRIPGVLNSINLKWSKEYPWEINISGLEGGLDEDMLVMPHVLDVSVAFTPVHNFLPKKSIHSPFIIPHDINNHLKRKGQKWYKAKIADSYKEADIDHVRKELGLKPLKELPPTPEVVESQLKVASAQDPEFTDTAPIDTTDPNRFTDVGQLLTDLETVHSAQPPKIRITPTQNEGIKDLILRGASDDEIKNFLLNGIHHTTAHGPL